MGYIVVHLVCPHPAKQKGGWGTGPPALLTRQRRHFALRNVWSRERWQKRGTTSPSYRREVHPSDAGVNWERVGQRLTLSPRRTMAEGGYPTILNQGTNVPRKKGAGGRSKPPSFGHTPRWEMSIGHIPTCLNKE